MKYSQIVNFLSPHSTAIETDGGLAFQIDHGVKVEVTFKPNSYAFSGSTDDQCETVLTLSDDMITCKRYYKDNSDWYVATFMIEHIGRVSMSKNKYSLEPNHI